MVTTCWSWAWSNGTSPSKWVGLGSPLAACSVYGDLTCSVHTVNNLYMFDYHCHFYLCNRGPYVRLALVPNTLSSWNKDIIISMMKQWCCKTPIVEAPIIFWCQGKGLNCLSKRFWWVGYFSPSRLFFFFVFSFFVFFLFCFVFCFSGFIYLPPCVDNNLIWRV